MRCIICGAKLTACEDGTLSTLLGYHSPPGHNHDDNCLRKVYFCENGHSQIISKRRRCPNPECDWVGKENCFCHDGKKVDEWPEVDEIRPAWWKNKKEKENEKG
jgi:hypothetical protein